MVEFVLAAALALVTGLLIWMIVRETRRKARVLRELEGADLHPRDPLTYSRLMVQHLARIERALWSILAALVVIALVLLWR